MKKPHDVRIETKDGEFVGYLSHKNRTSWRHDTALRHALDYIRKNPDHKCHVAPC